MRSITDLVTKSSEVIELVSVYDGLPSFNKGIFQVLAVGIPYSRYNIYAFARYLENLGIHPPSSKNITQQSVMKAVDLLQRLKLVDWDKNPEPSVVHQAILDALEGEHREGFLAFFASTPENKSKERDIANYLSHALRLKIYLLPTAKNAEKLAEEYANNPLFLSLITNNFICKSIPLSWICTLPFRIQSEIFHTQMIRLYYFNQMDPNFPLLLQRFSPCIGKPQYTSITRTWIEYAVCSADLRKVTPAMLQCLDHNNYEDLKLYASVLFLQGDIEEAIESFARALKMAKKALNKKKYFFPDACGLYYLLALLSRGEGADYMEIFNFASIVLSKQHNTLIDSFVIISKYITFANEKKNLFQEISQKYSESTHPINLAIDLLCKLWVGNSVSKQQTFEPALKSMSKGFPGIVRIMAEVLSALFPKNDPYAKYLESTQECYRISFVKLVAVKSDWEHSLERLEYLFAPQNEASSQKIAAEGCARKLVWIVSCDPPYVCHALDQKINAKGEWTKGRNVALERLSSGGPDLDFATEQDRKVMCSIIGYKDDSWGSWGKVSYSFSHKKAFMALINHSNIIDVNTNLPLEFVKGTVELIVKETDKDYEISLSQPLQKEENFALVKETDTRYQIIDYSQELINLAEVIGPSNKLTIPKAAKKRLQTLIKSVERHYPVQSELHESTVRKEGNQELYMQFVPLDSGIKVNLLVRPFGVEGPSFRPGQGFQTPQALVKGKSQRVLRNLQEEREKANALIASIDILAATDIDQDEWILEDPNHTLGLLSALHERPDSAKMLWPSGKKISVTQAVGPKNLSLRIKSENDWFALDGKVQLDDNLTLELKELLKLLESNSTRFVQLSDSQYMALTVQFKKQLLELKAITQSDRNTLTIHPLASSALDEILHEVSDIRVDAKWKAVKERLAKAETHQPVVPKTLQAELRPYQIEGFQWLSRLVNWGVGACLADDMGLGKTLQAIALILEHAHKGPTLVVAPTSVCHNWQSECLKFAPALQVMLHANERNEQQLAAIGPMQLLVTSYGLLHQETELLSKIEWQTIILDEAQVIKNLHTKRSQAAMQLKGENKLILTGTPIENRLSEIWNLFRFINPGLLGSHESFVKRFADPIEQKKDPAARQALKKLIHPFILRRLKTEVLTELPPRIEKTLVIPFEKEEQAFYEAARQNALEKLSQLSSKEAKRIHILAELTRLRQACCHPALIAPEIELSSTKLNMFLELVEELCANNHRALVFSQFVGCLSKARQLLDEKQISYQYLDGSTPINERQKRVNAFQNGEGDLFLISLKAGGTGLNLTTADYVIHLDPWWNPAVEDQASDRAHRIGQTRPVTIYRIIMENSIEEKILKLHDSKRGLATDLLQGTNVSGTLSDEELLAMLK